MPLGSAIALEADAALDGTDRYGRLLARPLEGVPVHRARSAQRVETGKSGPPARTPPPSGKCDPSYSGGCVPSYTPDVDCADIRAFGIAPVRVIGADPHRLDGDGDGLGCE